MNKKNKLFDNQNEELEDLKVKLRILDYYVLKHDSKPVVFNL
jgi:hypothetical protein